MLGVIAATIFYKVWQRPSDTPQGSLAAQPAAQAGTDAAARRDEQMTRRAPTPLPDGHFILTSKSRNVGKEAGRDMKVDGDVELKYAHEKTSDGIVVSFHSLGTKRFDKWTV